MTLIKLNLIQLSYLPTTNQFIFFDFCQLVSFLTPFVCSSASLFCYYIASLFKFNFKCNQISRKSKHQQGFVRTKVIISLIITCCCASVNGLSYTSKFGNVPTYSYQSNNATASSPSKYTPLNKFQLSSTLKPLLIQTSSGHVLGRQQQVWLRATTLAKNGYFELKEKESFEHRVDTFHGIPYARPPIGHLRFRPPQPSTGWPGYVFNATQSADACVQYPDLFFGNFEGSIMWNPVTPMHEDCLTLTIWLAERNNPIRNNFRKPQLPVLVWIYGGGFYSGSTEIPAYDYTNFAALQDVIVVAINYRVASLGFFYLGTSEAPGNVGMLDQLMALGWIKQNIASFGGDSNRITLIGESAGAVSIGLHLRSPLSVGLFQRVIMQSGGATCPWGTDSTEHALWRSLMLAYRVGCLGPRTVSYDNSSINTHYNHHHHQKSNSNTFMGKARRQVEEPESLNGFDNEHKSVNEDPIGPDNEAEGLDPDVEDSNDSDRKLTLKQLKEWANQQSGSWMQCMRQTSASELIDKEWHNLGLIQFPALPIADGFFLPKRPQIGDSITAHEQNNRIDLLVGSVSEESSFFLVYQLTEFLNLSEQVRVTRKQLEETARNHFRKEDPLLVDAIVNAYTNWPDPDDTIANRHQLVKLFDDSYFTCHVNEMARRYTEEGHAVYSYYFRHRSSRSPWPQWMGVLHADEIAFVIGEPLLSSKNYTHFEMQLSVRMMSMWANFANTGNPTKGTSGQFNPVQNEVWPKHTVRQQEYKDFVSDSNHSSIGSGPRLEKCAFWLNYLPDFRKKLEKLRRPCNSSISKWNSTFVSRTFLFFLISIVWTKITFSVYLN